MSSSNQTTRIAAARLELIQRAMESGSRAPFIRPYRDTDQDAVMHICRTTVHPSVTQEEILDIVPYIFVLPYVVLYPEYTFILDSGAGDAVGYIVAAPCTRTFQQRYMAEYVTTLDRARFPPPPPSPGLSLGNEIESHRDDSGAVAAALLQRLYDPEHALLHPDFPALVEDYPAHLHIDILPAFQGGGGGRALITALLVRLRDDAVQGIHLMKAGDQVGSEAFYKCMGFERYAVVMDGGASGEQGRKVGGGVCMVRKVGGD